MSGGLSQQFCVRWNSHLGSLGAAFPQLLAGQRFVDVTLACEGHQVHCHRLVLAACSSYFESLLGENPCKHPIIILPRDIKLWEIQALVDFMYKGEVNVSQAGLPDLLKCAEILQIRGLCGSDAALNLNQVSSNTSNSLSTTTTNLPNDNLNKSSNSKANFTSTPNKTNNQANLSQISSNNNSVSKSSNSKTNDSQTTSAILSTLTNHSPKTETTSPTTVNQNATTSNNLSIDSPMISIPLLASNASCVSMDDCEDSLNGSASEIYVDDPDIKLQEDYSNDGDAIVKLEPENKQPSSSLFFGPQTGYQQETSKFGKIRVKSRDNLFENYNSNKNYHPSTSSSATYNLVVNEYDDSQNFVASPPSSTSGSVLQRNIQIIENELLPPSLKFNKNSMTIFVKKTNDLNDSGIGGDTELIGHHTTEVDANNSNENLYENIVCSPNLLTLSFDEQQDLLDINSDQGNSIVNSYLTATSTPRKIDKKRFKAVSMDENGFEVTSRSTNIVPPLLKYDTSASNKQLLKELKRQDEKLAIESSLLSGGPPPESFVLRNPRGNQPRTYNTDALWAALMNVKSGESIYRASRIHNVPRKTLRNWMKRWDIKSAYPMPRQLKQAAEKRKAKNVCDYKNEMLVKLAMANVTCEYEGSTYASGRRVRRSETLLRQAAECVSRGQTFQTVSDMFHIPISTIRFFMARKGILPRRKRGRASGASSSDTISLHLNSEISRKSQSNRNTKNFPRNIYKAVRLSSKEKEYDKDVVGVGGRRFLSEQDFLKSVPWVKLGNHRFRNDKSLDGGSRLLDEKDFFKSMPLVKLARIKM